MESNNVYCDQCRKNIGSVELAWFSDREKDLDFCSETCHLKWSESNWTDIHEDFVKETYENSGKTYQQEWEKANIWGQNNITKQEAKEWIEVGFKPNDYYEVKKWKNLNFSPTETKTWLEVGLDKKDGEFVSWLRTKLRSPKLVKNNLKQLRNDYRCGLCDKCQKTNTSENWCQPCADQEWEKLSGQELINKFIEQQQSRETDEENKLKWIPYEEFTDIEHLADGGFSKICKAKWERWKRRNESDYVVLKSLNHSRNITLEFLTEIANTKLVDSYVNVVIKCHGISQDPNTKNYVMVMDYKEGGNLRQYLQSKDNKFSLEDKLYKLSFIASGLKNIHNQNLVHKDFHSGNILGSKITDLGLSRPVNQQKKTGKIFGVLPYVAPEVLRGQPYTQKADVYSFGIIAYELLANSYPYLEMNNMDLSLKVCNGYRPNLDKVPLPQECKDLIKRCWDNNPDKRPSAEELSEITNDWRREIENKKNTPFYQQYQAIEAEYNTFSQNTPYQIHSNAITTSKLINTNQITELLNKSKEINVMTENFDSLLINTQDLAELNLKDSQEIQTQIEQPPKQ